MSTKPKKEPEDPVVAQAKTDLEDLRQEYLAKEQALLDPLSKEQRLEIGEPIKNIFKLDTFNANGNKYITRTSLCISRFEEFEKLQARVGFGVEFAELFANIRKAYDFVQEAALADAAVALHEIMTGVSEHLEGREHEILLVCSLFICREGENPAKYDFELNKAKIQDWREEGIEMQGFFSLAFNLVKGFTPAYKKASQDIFQKVTEARKAANV